MSLLSGVKTDSAIQTEKDTLGGGRTLVESGVHAARIKLAYLSKATSGALALNIVADIAGSEYKEALYITNKNGENFYVTKDNAKEKRFLAGFLHADAIALLTTGKSILELPTENKIVKLYNFQAKAELPTEVEVLVGLIGKEVQLGILKTQEFKRAKQDDGTYVETTETQETNSIEKVFHATHGKTVAECRAQAESATFIEEWKNTWAGKLRDKTKGKSPNGGNTGTAGIPQQTSAIAAPSTTSLFN